MNKSHLLCSFHIGTKDQVPGGLRSRARTGAPEALRLLCLHSLVNNGIKAPAKTGGQASAKKGFGFGAGTGLGGIE